MGEGMSGMEDDWMPPDGMGAAELLRKLAGDLLLGNAALYDYLDYGKTGPWSRTEASRRTSARTRPVTRRWATRWRFRS